jgi:plasmid stabilization system protein ParE
MTFSVHELPRAKADKRAIIVWLHERSPKGARAWLNAYDAALVGLKTNAATFSVAFENDDCPDLEVKQAFFKTRAGRVYRLLYSVDGNEVYVLRVRGPGQAAVDPEDIR